LAFIYDDHSFISLSNSPPQKKAANQAAFFVSYSFVYNIRAGWYQQHPPPLSAGRPLKVSFCQKKAPAITISKLSNPCRDWWANTVTLPTLSSTYSSDSCASGLPRHTDGVVFTLTPPQPKLCLLSILAETTLPPSAISVCAWELMVKSIFAASFAATPVGGAIYLLYSSPVAESSEKYCSCGRRNGPLRGI